MNVQKGKCNYKKSIGYEARGKLFKSIFLFVIVDLDCVPAYDGFCICWRFVFEHKKHNTQYVVVILLL